ncbi:MAG: RsiV family protein [Coprobacillus sp.]
MRKSIVSFLAVFMMFSINMNIVFAKEDIPYYKVVRKEKIDLYGAPVSIEVKHIENVKNKDVKKQINLMIDNYVKTTLNKQKEELKKTQPNRYTELGISVSDYYSSNNYTSFSLDFLQIMASSYEEKQYHTIDLRNGKEITIDNWLGKDYARIVKDEVIKQVLQQNQQNGTDIYFMNKVNHLNIQKDQSYYINEDGQIVVTFPKYEIAPGYVGLPEFIMPNHLKEVSQ